MAAPPKKPTNRDKPVDWKAIDPLWRAGIVSVAELSRRFHVSRAAIAKHYEELGVERDLAPAIRSKAGNLANRAAAAGQEQVAPPAATAGAEPTDAETVDHNARVQADAILRHRRDVLAAQELTSELLQELRATTLDLPTFERLDELVRKAAKGGKVKDKDLPDLLALYRRVTSISTRIENSRKLAETMKLLVELERKVLAIDDNTPVDPAKRIAEEISSGMDALQARFKARGALK